MKVVQFAGQFVRPSSRKWVAQIAVLWRLSQMVYAQIAADVASDGGRWLRRRGEGGEEVVVMVQGVALWAERTREDC